jgi:hypothetical protein
MLVDMSICLEKYRLNQNVVSPQPASGEDSYLGISIDTCFRWSCRTSSPDKFPFLKYIQHWNASRQLKADNLRNEGPVNISIQGHRL